ncbi:hypothetical protein BST17_24830 [Mycolicibacterium bacteremicum]|uniref:Uncharacterized protein n=1 Tax=Mycolicibacterium bacteremicum TaxID=564198 RepID=A0A1W9YPY4_MYCBA|nr:hypothetical protein BST17_24830 [Mycolicibacterium bacteremicum]
MAKRLTAEIVGPSDSYNGGRLTGDQANGLAHLVVDTLLTQGWAVLRIPEGEPHRGYSSGRWPVESQDPDAAVVIRSDGRIVSDGISNPYRHPNHALSHAVALIAARDEALGRSFTDAS